MGWAGPTNWPDSSPKNCWAGLGPPTSFLGLGRTSPDLRAGPESPWPIPILLGQTLSGPTEKKKRNERRGTYFPPLASCMQKRFCMQEAKTCARINKKRCRGRRRTWRGGDDGLLTVLRWRRWQCPNSRRIPTGSGSPFRFTCFYFSFLGSLSVSTIPSFSTLGFR